jgi:hypothetical protein
MGLTHSIIWDGRFIQEVPNAFAQAEQAAGRAQIFEGPLGYQPYFTMLPLSAFPFVPPTPGFNPDSLFAPTDIGGVFDISRMDLCYQDLAGTVPVTAVGQEVLSIRSRNNPAFLVSFNPIYSPTPCTYELDSQGYPYLFDTNPTGQWTVYGREDSGSATGINAYTVTLCGIGQYESGNDTLSAGSTVIGDTDGAASPYTYSAVYATETPPESGTFVVTGGLVTDADGLTLPYTGEGLDNRPFVFAVRVTDGDQTMQINLETEGQYNGVASAFPPPVGMRLWIGSEGGWYGGVLIGRWLDDEENYNTQVWCGDLAGITLVGSKPFYPLDLFLPGDRGGFYNPNHENTLFQTRTGPTVPVTGNGDPVQFMVDENGQFNLARTLAAPGFAFQNGLLEAPRGGALFGTLSSGNVAGFGQVTVVMGGVINTPIPIEANTLVLGFDVDNTTAFGGAGISINLAPNPSLRLLNWVPPGSSPTANMSIPANELGSPFVFGYRQDEASPTQHMFFNDVELNPTITYSPVTSQASGAEYIGTAGQDGAPVVSVFGGPAFFINRRLSDTDLAQLKTWMRENTPAP